MGNCMNKKKEEEGEEKKDEDTKSEDKDSKKDGDGDHQSSVRESRSSGSSPSQRDSVGGTRSSDGSVKPKKGSTGCPGLEGTKVQQCGSGSRDGSGIKSQSRYSCNRYPSSREWDKPCKSPPSPNGDGSGSPHKYSILQDKSRKDDLPYKLNGTPCRKDSGHRGGSRDGVRDTSRPDIMSSFRNLSRDSSKDGQTDSDRDSIRDVPRGSSRDVSRDNSRAISDELPSNRYRSREQLDQTCEDVGNSCRNDLNRDSRSRISLDAIECTGRRGVDRSGAPCSNAGGGSHGGKPLRKADSSRGPGCGTTKCSRKISSNAGVTAQGRYCPGNDSLDEEEVRSQYMRSGIAQDRMSQVSRPRCGRARRGHRRRNGEKKGGGCSTDRRRPSESASERVGRGGSSNRSTHDGRISQEASLLGNSTKVYRCTYKTSEARSSVRTMSGSASSSASSGEKRGTSGGSRSEETGGSNDNGLKNSSQRCPGVSVRDLERSEDGPNRRVTEQQTVSSQGNARDRSGHSASNNGNRLKKCLSKCPGINVGDLERSENAPKITTTKKQTVSSQDSASDPNEESASSNGNELKKCSWKCPGVSARTLVRSEPGVNNRVTKQHTVSSQGRGSDHSGSGQTPELEKVCTSGCPGVKIGGPRETFDARRDGGGVRADALVRSSGIVESASSAGLAMRAPGQWSLATPSRPDSVRSPCLRSPCDTGRRRREDGPYSRCGAAAYDDGRSYYLRDRLITMPHVRCSAAAYDERSPYCWRDRHIPIASEHGSHTGTDIPFINADYYSSRNHLFPSFEWDDYEEDLTYRISTPSNTSNRAIQCERLTDRKVWKNCRGKRGRLVYGKVLYDKTKRRDLLSRTTSTSASLRHKSTCRVTPDRKAWQPNYL